MTTRLSQCSAEMSFAMIAGKTFRDAGFMLEGDGFCVPYAKRYLSVLSSLLDEWKREKKTHASITGVLSTARASGLLQGQCDMLVDRLSAALTAVGGQADNAIFSKMNEVMAFYTAAGLWCPKRFLSQRQRPTWQGVFDGAVEVLSSLKGLSIPNLKTLLLSELPVLQRLASERENTTYFDSPAQLWMWWLGIRSEVPTWFGVARFLVLMQPTSAAIERFYSLVKANTSSRQTAEAEETFAVRTMILFNLP